MATRIIWLSRVPASERHTELREAAYKCVSHPPLKLHLRRPDTMSGHPQPRYAVPVGGTEVSHA